MDLSVCLIHLLTEGYLGCFHSGEIVSSDAINIHVQVFLSVHKFSFLWDKYPGVGLLAHMLSVCFTI